MKYNYIIIYALIIFILLILIFYKELETLSPIYSNENSYTPQNNPANINFPAFGNTPMMSPMSTPIMSPMSTPMMSPILTPMIPPTSADEIPDTEMNELPFIDITETPIMSPFSITETPIMSPFSIGKTPLMSPISIGKTPIMATPIMATPSKTTKKDINHNTPLFLVLMNEVDQFNMPSIIKNVPVIDKTYYNIKQSKATIDFNLDSHMDYGNGSSNLDGKRYLYKSMPEKYPNKPFEKVTMNNLPEQYIKKL